MSEPHELSATELLARFRAGSLSPVDATQAVLERIAAWEPQLCATYALDPDGALAQAKASQARWRSGRPQGALDGVPLMF